MVERGRVVVAGPPAEGRTADRSTLLAPSDVAAMVSAALRLPRRAEVTDITIRPAQPG